MSDWARHAPPGRGYEVSTAGDRRFSALVAALPDGRTVEEAYQLDVKGYRAQGDDWRLGKGRPALDGRSRADLWPEYLALWREWAGANPALMDELDRATRGRVLTDRFATSDTNQAHALSTLLWERRHAAALCFPL